MEEKLTFPELGGVLLCSMKEKIFIFSVCARKSFEISSRVVEPGARTLICSERTLPNRRDNGVRGRFIMSAHTASILAGSEPQCGVARKKIAAVEVRISEKRADSTTEMLIACFSVRHDFPQRRQSLLSLQQYHPYYGK